MRFAGREYLKNVANSWVLSWMFGEKAERDHKQLAISKKERSFFLWVVWSFAMRKPGKNAINLSLSLSFSLSLSLNKYAHTHTHTHTHIYIYILRGKISKFFGGYFFSWNKQDFSRSPNYSSVIKFFLQNVCPYFQAITGFKSKNPSFRWYAFPKLNCIFTYLSYIYIYIYVGVCVCVSVYIYIYKM